jgi:hypothetical protein
MIEKQLMSFNFSPSLLTEGVTKITLLKNLKRCNNH